jgi:hypothetical protein
MVDKNLKHGMGTQRALGKGGHSLEAERQRWQPADEHQAPVAAAAGHAGHGGAGMNR